MWDVVLSPELQRHKGNLSVLIQHWGLLPCRLSLMAMERWQEGMGMGETPRAAARKRRVNKAPPKAAAWNPSAPISYCINYASYPGRKTVLPALSFTAVRSITLGMRSQKKERINFNNTQLPPGTGQHLQRDLSLTCRAFGLSLLLKWKARAMPGRRPLKRKCAKWKEKK